MKSITLTPTSELIFYSIYPESSAFKKSIDVEEEIAKRLTRGCRFDDYSVHNFLERESEIVQNRGNDIDSYYFCGEKSLDDCLDVLLSSFDNFSRLLSYKDNMTNLTLSELVAFRSILVRMVCAYNKDKKKSEKDLEGYSKSTDKIVRSSNSLTEMNLEYEKLKAVMEELEKDLKIQGQYSHFWEYLSNVIYSRIGLLMGCREDRKRTETNYLTECFRILSSRSTQLNKDLKQYERDNLGRVEHDQKILSKYDVSVFIRQ